MSIIFPVFGFNKHGGERVLAKLASQFTSMGMQVKMVSYCESDLPYFPVEAEVVWIDKNGGVVESNTKIVSSRKKWFLTSMIALARYLRSHSSRNDIVIANLFLTAYPVLFARSEKKYYYIQAYEPEMLKANSLFGGVFKGLAWLSYYLPLERVVNADIYRRYKNIRAEHVVFPGLDLNIFYPRKDNINTPKTRLVIGCIGRLAEWKGANDVARAVRILRQQGHDVEFRVAFHEVVADKSEYEMVFPHGDNQLADFYRGLDVMIAPGHIQLGAVHYPVIEAMACNVSVITTGYYPANNNNAYLVPIRSPEQIAQAISEIVDYPEVAAEKRKQALNDVQKMAWEKVSRAFLEIIL